MTLDVESRHIVSSIMIEPEIRDTARGTAYVTVLTLHDEALRLLVTGAYHDAFVRTADRWLLHERRFDAMSHSALAGRPVVEAADRDDE